MTLKYVKNIDHAFDGVSRRLKLNTPHKVYICNCTCLDGRTHPNARIGNVKFKNVIVIPH